MATSTCLVALGSNLGDRRRILVEAIDGLAGHPQVEVVRRSHFYETPAIGGPPGQGAFLNAVVCLHTSLSPVVLHRQLGAVENRLGRHRRARWAARTLDLDLLLYDDRQIDTARLKVPHPRMAWRSFVLAPAAEIAGEMIHPLIGWSLETLWRHLRSAPRYVAIAGPPEGGPRPLADEVVQRLEGPLQGKVQLVADPIPSDVQQAFARDPQGEGGRLAIEFSRRRAAALPAAPGGAVAGDEGSGWRISDFWWPQSLAWAASSADPACQAALEEAHRTAGGTVLSPRLLVLWPANPPGVGPGGGGAEGPRDAGGQPAPSLWPGSPPGVADWIERHYEGPLLALETGRGAGPVEEVVAAVLGMACTPVRR